MVGEDGRQAARDAIARLTAPSAAWPVEQEEWQKAMVRAQKEMQQEGRTIIEIRDVFAGLVMSEMTTGGGVLTRCGLTLEKLRPKK